MIAIEQSQLLGHCRFGNYSLPGEVHRTFNLPYECTGAELSLLSCNTTGSVCNILNSNQEDIVAVACEKVREQMQKSYTCNHSTDHFINTILYLQAPTSVSVKPPETTTSSHAKPNISNIVLILLLIVVVRICS